MPRIFDNIDEKLLDNLKYTAQVVKVQTRLLTLPRLRYRPLYSNGTILAGKEI